MNLGSDSEFSTERSDSSSSSEESEEEQEEEQGAGALRIAAQANEAIINRRTVDGSYEREWKVFRKWVDEMRLTDVLPAGAVYLTRLNVDLYFQQVVALKENIEPKTARRVVAALQCMARREEGLRTFQIDNGSTGHVFQALQAQTQRYALRMLLQNNVDAHANLPTHSLEEEEFERAIDFVMANNKPYASDFVLSWTACTSTFARNDSLRKFNLEDVCTDKCHGPLFDRDNPVHAMDKWMLSFILQPMLHKDDEGRRQQQNANATKKRAQVRSTKRNRKKVIGSYRHQKWKSCTTAAFGISLFLRQYFDPLVRNMTFEYGDDPLVDNPTWRKVKVVEKWRNQKQCEQAYKEVMRQCGIQWKKVTHLRSHGIELGSRAGLNAEEIATLSKHKTERIFEAYLTELYPPVLKVMAGFRVGGDPYFVARTEDPLPLKDETAVRAVFPKIDVWRAEQSGPNGDKHQSAQNFLYSTLPFLARVLLQDAPRWIGEYPNSTFARSFMSKMTPAYNEWATRFNVREEQFLCVRETAHVDDLNDAQRDSYERMGRALQANTTQVLAYRNDVQEIPLQVADVITRALKAQREMIRFEFLNWMADRPFQPRTQAAAPPARLPTQQPAAREAQEAQQPGMPLRQQLGEATVAAALGAIVPAVPLEQVLQPQGVEPLIPLVLPATMVEVLEEHLMEDLNQYRHRGATSKWSHRGKKDAYGKRQYLFEKICSKAENPLFMPALLPANLHLAARRVAAAEAYDRQRNGSSVDKLRCALKARDIETGKAQRRKRR
jgi:hypothetical protein